MNTGFQAVYTQVATNQTAYSLCLGIDKLLSSAYNLDDATSKCYLGAFESYDTLKNYGQFATSPAFLLNNILFNFGYLYATMKDIIIYLTGGP